MKILPSRIIPAYIWFVAWSMKSTEHLQLPLHTRHTVSPLTSGQHSSLPVITLSVENRPSSQALSSLESRSPWYRYVNSRFRVRAHAPPVNRSSSSDTPRPSLFLTTNPRPSATPFLRSRRPVPAERNPADARLDESALLFPDRDYDAPRMMSVPYHR
ncbi:hypothetical protein EX30DRAFT_119133 [Ascodesmis nigricans]|uniref:Uncharacterized protein n=1 Tax=Ascodesmis nigricans TaxID=341454 RepID=A0A4S2MPR2_9PEZI|nr:hypothetical protein EX30DRAFT_119133 [Ascodesmis nigricans]